MPTRSVPICLFPLGKIVATPSALRCLTSDDLISAVRRHQAGDWGDMDSEDKQTNDQALESGGRLFSVYRGTNGTKFYIITEADRRVTTALLPEDY